MKFSENWLRSHVPTTATHEELLATLTAIGLEVEEVTRLGDNLDHVVVAEIVEATPHPEADRLQVCKVDDGSGEFVQIVCGAPNARVGLKTVLAKVGAVLPGDFAIKPAKLRGVESFGMLCSAKELGLDPDAASGITELPSDAPVGATLTSYLALPDASIEIKLTPNRADCFGVRGIAFDVAAATGGAVSTMTIDAVPASGASVRSVSLKAGENAPRFASRIIEGVSADAVTPIHMQERLRRSGIRPISFLVDVTQYVMLELGQPMHAYDNDLLKGDISARMSVAGESLTLLDGRTVSLEDDGFVVIADGTEAIGLAGIMGGESTKVSDQTRNVFLEAAHFAPQAIMGRGRKLGLHTDASHRFERGVDPELPAQAIEVATALILSVAGGSPGPVQVVTLDEHLPVARSIRLRRERLASMLGVKVDDARVFAMLEALGLSPVESNDGWTVTTPTRRFDLEIEEDLIEEVARIHGYDAIPTTLPQGAAPLRVPSEDFVDAAFLRRQMAARDYREAINYAFVDAELLEKWSLVDERNVVLANPLSRELGVMRPALLPGLVAAAARNTSRQQHRVRLFELGNVFAKTDADPLHTQRLAGIALGDRQVEQWNGKSVAADFYSVKGDLEALADLSQASLSFEADASVAYAHPGRSARILRDGAVVGWIGQVHPSLTAAMEIDVPVYGFELDLTALRLKASRSIMEISKFPSVRRDLAFVLEASRPWSAVRTTVASAAGPLLKDLMLFDQYQGKGVEDGHKSLAIGVVLQDTSRTLTDAEVDGVVSSVIDAMAAEQGAVIRS